MNYLFIYLSGLGMYFKIKNTNKSVIKLKKIKFVSIANGRTLFIYEVYMFCVYRKSVFNLH